MPLTRLTRPLGSEPLPEGNVWTPTSRSSVAKSSHPLLPALPPGDAVLRLRWVHPHGDRPQQLYPVLNDCPLGKITLTSMPKARTLRVPGGFLQKEPQELALAASHLDARASRTRPARMPAHWRSRSTGWPSTSRPHQGTSVTLKRVGSRRRDQCGGSGGGRGPTRACGGVGQRRHERSGSRRHTRGPTPRAGAAGASAPCRRS